MVDSVARWVGDARVQRLLLPAGLLVLAATLIYNLRYGPARFDQSDFQSFYGAAVALRSGIDPYLPAVAWINAYQPTGSGALFGTKVYVYAPFFGYLLTPFTFLPKYIALTLWDFLNVGFLVATIFLALDAAGVRMRWAVVIALAGAASLIQAVHKEWFLGQTDVFILGSITFSFWLRTRGHKDTAGLALGIVCAIKPTMALLLFFLLWKREFRYALLAGVSGALLLLVPFAWLGSDVWNHQRAIWNFWSNQFVAQAHNDSPKGVLTRLFTANPVVRPIFVAPALVTALWAIVIAAVGLCAAALVTSRPIRRDLLSLLELGLALEAVFLVSPLTEWPYLLVLIVPLVGCVAWLISAYQQGTRKGLVGAAIATVAIWVGLIGPAGFIEYRVVDHWNRPGLSADALVILAPIYLYVLIGAFLLQLVVIGRVRKIRLTESLTGMPRTLPNVTAEFVHDAWSALPAAITRTARVG